MLTVDVDECAEMTACDVHATCNNSAGSYQCLCEPGYTGTGVLCYGLSAHAALHILALTTTSLIQMSTATTKKTKPLLFFSIFFCLLILKTF